jgi:hypothetical protein
MSASDALRRHLLGQGLPDDRQTLIDCHQAINERPGISVQFPSLAINAEVRRHLGLPPRASAACVLEALYGARQPTANMAIALALDAIDSSPGKWVADVDEDDRWAQQEEEDDLAAIAQEVA